MKPSYFSLLALCALQSTSLLYSAAPATKNITDPTTIHTLYQLAKDTSEILFINNVEYWIAYGSLLGAVRHGGIIPWDDDLDFCMRQENVPTLLGLRAQFDALGYEIVEMRFGYKIFPKNGHQAPGKHYKMPFLDIFVVTEDKNKIRFICKTPGERDGGILYITQKELYPLRIYNFGELQLIGPHNPTPFLDAAYGKDWPETVNVYNHEHQQTNAPKPKKIMGIPLSKMGNNPAQPTGPLQNRLALCYS